MTENELWCAEFSEVVLQRRLHPFHVSKLKEAIGHNNWDMINGVNRNGWKIVFVGDEEECHKYTETIGAIMERKGRIK